MRKLNNNEDDNFNKEISNSPSNKRINLREDPYVARMLNETESMRAYINYETAKEQIRRIDDAKDLCDEIKKMSEDLNSNFYSNLEISNSFGDIHLEDIPDGLRGSVKYIAYNTGWSYLSVLLFVLFSIAAATRGRYIAKINDEWLEAITLYVIVCAESGNMKSNLLKLIMRPHESFENRKQAQHAEKLSKSNNIDIVIAREIALKQSKKNHGKDLVICKEALKTLANNVRHDRNMINDYCPVEEASALPRVFTEDTSFPKLYATMQDNGGGSTFASAEGNTFLHLVLASRSPLDIFTKAHGYEKFITETKRDGTKILQQPFLNIGIVVNPDIARQLYSNDRLGLHGLSPRFAVCFEGKQDEIVEDNSSKSDYNSYSEKIENLLEDNFTQEPSRKLIEIQFSPEAKEELLIILKETERKQNRTPKGQTHYRAYLRKVRGLVARIATILHIWGHAKPGNHFVSKNDVLIARKIVYSISLHAEYAFSANGLSAYYDAQKILDWIKRHRHSFFTSTQVAKGIEKMKNDNIFPALDALEKLNIIRQLITPSKPRLCVVHKNFITSA